MARACSRFGCARRCPRPSRRSGARYALQDEGDGRYRLHVAEAAAVSQALDAARAAGCEPLALAYGRRDLEQVFMQLTQRSLRD